MSFNPYSFYSYQAGNIQSTVDGKIFVDLKKLGNLTELDEVKDFVEKTFNAYEAEQIIDYPNDVKVCIVKEDERIMVGALQKDEQIFGKSWRYVKEE